MPHEPLLVSVVMPCLNEAETVAGCVATARETLRASNLAGEVVVADNGSTDGSVRLAEEAGARVVHVAERGYGAALLAGIAAANGRHIVMGDADASYDFRAVPDFVRALERGADLVMGSRFRGRIEDGAMPPLHRYLGNPVLSYLGRLFFRLDVSDFHCGIRGFRKEAVERLALRTTGMEFASEMVVKAALAGLAIGEIPVTLRKDGRSHPPHLRTWRDGWRHLRFLLVYSPRWLFLVPGLLLAAFGAGLLVWLLPGPRNAFGVRLDVHTMLAASAFVLVGSQAVFFAVFSKVFAAAAGLLPEDARLTRWSRGFSLEAGLLAGVGFCLAGFALVGIVIARWAGVGYGDLYYGETMRWMIPGVLLLSLGAEVVLSSFFLSILALKRR